MYTDAAQLSARRKYPTPSIKTEYKVPIFPLLLFMHQHTTTSPHLTSPHLTSPHLTPVYTASAKIGAEGNKNAK